MLQIKKKLASTRIELNVLKMFKIRKVAYCTYINAVEKAPCTYYCGFIYEHKKLAIIFNIFHNK